MYIVQSIHIWERVQDEKKQERQKFPAGTRQTDSKNWGLVWRNRKKTSQIIKDYFHLPFFLLIILCSLLSGGQWGNNKSGPLANGFYEWMYFTKKYRKETDCYKISSLITCQRHVTREVERINRISRKLWMLYKIPGRWGGQIGKRYDCYPLGFARVSSNLTLIGTLRTSTRLDSTFLDPNGTSFAPSHFRAQKSLDSRAHPPPMPLVLDLARLKTITYHAI